MVTLEAFEHAFATDYGNPKSEVSDPHGHKPILLKKDWSVVHEVEDKGARVRLLG
jgi:hypothetical protein